MHFGYYKYLKISVIRLNICEKRFTCVASTGLEHGTKELLLRFRLTL